MRSSDRAPLSDRSRGNKLARIQAVACAGERRRARGEQHAPAVGHGETALARCSRVHHDCRWTDQVGDGPAALAIIDAICQGVAGLDCAPDPVVKAGCSPGCSGLTISAKWRVLNSGGCNTATFARTVHSFPPALGICPRHDLTAAFVPFQNFEMQQ